MPILPFKPTTPQSAQVFSKTTTKTNPSAVFSLGLALFLCITLNTVPFGSTILYPFNLFTTFIHESGHAIMAILTGGQVISMGISPNGSGLTITATSGRIAAILVAFAGYVSSAIYSGTLLIWAGRSKKYGIVLQASSVALIAAIVFFSIFSKDWLDASTQIGVSMKLFSIGVGFAIAAVLWLVALLPSEFALRTFVNFLAFECIFQGFGDIRTVFSLAISSNVQSDAVSLASYTGIPAVAWSVLWGLLSAYIIYKAICIAITADKQVA